MGMSAYKKARSIIEDVEEDADVAGPKAEALVSKAEQLLHLRFPPTYRRFLRELGAVEICGEELYGIVKSDFHNSGVPDAIWCTLAARRKLNLPADLVVIGDTGTGEFYCLQIMPDGSEGPVLTLDPRNPASRQEVASDFGTYFLERIEDFEDD